ncbi:MAG TPA: molybdenum cofactor biosynthesis protein MoaE [Parvularcula sp.]|nr:molybdenum cofactor biosynthesis protein MoaE [Parvularcula sp.]
MTTPDILVLGAPFDPEEEARRLRRTGAGAVVTFTGQVRSDGDASLRLVLEHCPGLTEKEISAFAASACERWPLEALVIRHRVGDLFPGEAIVFVGAAAAHRRAAFEAADFVMDYLKSAAPFWKREIDGRGARWIEPRSEDRRDLARWRAHT